MTTLIQRQVTDQGVGILTFDRPDSPANIFDDATFEELNAHLDFFEREAASVRGLVLATAKPKIFIAGADLKSFTKKEGEEALRQMVRGGQQTFNRLARLPATTVAAIHGACVGGGLEIALACDHRVASNDKSTKLGLPEVLIGILPGWGGSTRLPRLVGLPRALDLILTGRQVPAKLAQKYGLVEEVVFPERLREYAEQVAQRGGKAAKPRFFWQNLPPARYLIAARAEADVREKTRGNYPAPLRALQVVAGGLDLSFEGSLKLEEEGLYELVQTPACRNLVNVFFLQERAKKLRAPGAAAAPADPLPGAAGTMSGAGDGPVRPEADPAVAAAEAGGAGSPATAAAAPVAQAAVIGAGLMGAGIAQWVSARGVRVLLKDVAPAALGGGMRTVTKLYRDAVKRHRLTATEAQAGLDRVVPVTGDVPLHRLDLVIEAVVEKLEVKQALFAGLEGQVGPRTVLATNTSALSLDAIAGSLRQPERLVGIHFFNPVHRMELVEVIRGPRSSPQAVETALAFVKAIGKLPVLVKDSPGFLVNRILLPYMIESVRLFQEGYDPAAIDAAMLDFGMPMGPLRLTDEVGFDTCQHVAQDLEARLPRPVPTSDGLAKMIARGWLGRKSGRGFYVYPAAAGAGGRSRGKEGKETLNPELGAFRAGPVRETIDPELLRDRMVLLMVNEAGRVLEEGVVADPADVDFGMIMGTGWAPFRGGPLRYADTLGLPRVVARLDELAGAVGPHFGPCDLLRRRAAAAEPFYPGTR